MEAIDQTKSCEADAGASRFRSRAILLCLALTAAALALAEGVPGPAPAEDFGALEAIAARRALAGLPQAIELFRGGAYDEAGRVYARILAHLPGSDQEVAAAALLGLGEPETFRRLLAGLHSDLGLCHLRARRYEPAAASFERAAAIVSWSPAPRVSLGLVRMHQRRDSEARRAFEEAIALGAGGAKLWLDLGRVRLRSGDLPAARTALSEALGLAAAKADVQGWGTALEAERLLADADQQDGCLAAAEERLRRVLALAPGEPQARYRLAQLLLRAGRREEAREHLDRFAEASRTVASIQSLLASSPGRVEALQWVADTYRSLGLLHLAEVHYRQVLARDPADRGARQALLELAARANPPQRRGP